MTEPSQDRELRRVSAEYHWLAEFHLQTVRLHLGINLALALGALAVLKMEGPFFSDGLAAGIFVCGFLTTMLGVRSVRDSEEDLRAIARRKLELEHRHAQREGSPEIPASRARGVTIVLFSLGVFHLTSAVLTIWLTYISPPEISAESDTLAAIARLVICSGFDL